MLRVHFSHGKARNQEFSQASLPEGLEDVEKGLTSYDELKSNLRQIGSSFGLI